MEPYLASSEQRFENITSAIEIQLQMRRMTNNSKQIDQVKNDKQMPLKFMKLQKNHNMQLEVADYINRN